MSRRPRPTDPPCACCGTEGGYVREGDRSPKRTAGAALGVDGVLCARCYARLRARRRAAAIAASCATSEGGRRGGGAVPLGRPLATAPPGVAPCALCRTTGGYKARDSKRPARRSGVPFGVAGPLCIGCYDRLRYRDRAEDARPRARGGPR